MFAPDQLSDDKFLSGKLRLLQPIRGYRAATDPVLLAAACAAKPGESVLDMGCGVGAAALCLGWRVPDLRLFGVELQPDYADLARENAARNGVEVQVHTGDITQMPPPLRVNFDHVIANPPYYSSGTASPVQGRARAMQVELPLADWVQAGARRLGPGGWLTLICGADGLPSVLAGMRDKLGSVSVLPLQPRVGRATARVLVQARKGGRGAFRLLAPFVIHEGAEHSSDRESYTPAANAVLRHGADLLAHFR
ncbi:tRNA1(Val) (adenine(37)-N6)-methyltransferase [Pseudotabrizicola sp. L79]|uniref:tRNA1(Val) (adenine(37)-N6)-methyltransferase n=1 Tax=Pseudotabrizicola sp. L79 TaxID=3118402 RepID=UPI002F94D6AC